MLWKKERWSTFFETGILGENDIEMEEKMPEPKQKIIDTYNADGLKNNLHKLSREEAIEILESILPKANRSILKIISEKMEIFEEAIKISRSVFHSDKKLKKHKGNNIELLNQNPKKPRGKTYTLSTEGYIDPKEFWNDKPTLNFPDERSDSKHQREAGKNSPDAPDSLQLREAEQHSFDNSSDPSKSIGSEDGYNQQPKKEEKSASEKIQGIQKKYDSAKSEMIKTNRKITEGKRKVTFY
jgi:hypothetical protein